MGYFKLRPEAQKPAMLGVAVALVALGYLLPHSNKPYVTRVQQNVVRTVTRNKIIYRDRPGTIIMQKQDGLTIIEDTSYRGCVWVRGPNGVLFTLRADTDGYCARYAAPPVR